MSYTYPYLKKQISFKNETGGVRTPDAVLDQQLSTAYQMDDMRDEDVEIAEPQLAREEERTISRNVDRVDELGYPSVEQTLPLKWQTAMFLAKVMGSVVTVGVDSAETGLTVASGGGTATITITGKSYTVNEWAGDYVEVTGGDNSGDKYHILSNTADTLTFNITTDADLDGDTVKIVEGPFTHTITESDTLSTIALHYEHENTTDAQSVRIDLLGCLVKTLSILIEKNATATQDVTLDVLKSVAGTDIARPSEFIDAVYKWGSQVSTFSLTYNSLPLLDGDEVDSVRIDIENTTEPRFAIDDSWNKKIDIGPRDYIIVMKVHPQSKTLRDLRNTSLASYLTALAFVFKIQRSATDYIQFTFSSLYLAEYPQMVPSSTTKIVRLDATFRNAPARSGVARGTLAVEAKDNKGLIYYEGTQQA